MTPTEFVAGLADVMGVERTEIATVDRALAKHGLRQLARGRYRPDINLREGVQLVCAWAGAENRTLAADEVGRLERFFPEVIPLDEYELTKRTNPVFPRLFGVEEYELNGLNYLDIVSMAARQLAAGTFPEDRLWIAVERGGSPLVSYWAEFKTHDLNFKQIPIKFEFTSQRESAVEADINVKITASVRGTVLKWIHDVTEGA